jgi:hypothetical protein
MYAAVRRARPCGGQMVRDAAAQLSDGHDLPALRRLLRDYEFWDSVRMYTFAKAAGDASIGSNR